MAISILITYELIWVDITVTSWRDVEKKRYAFIRLSHVLCIAVVDHLT